ncbi:hypothetical protein Pcinc_029509 [Petrolisthes cinctipes]|uniref:Uncharacterized protein n=1 Tax=Petrolisthes cinctipes TaxID=88211 RepID=A0AAE1K7P6_PETCI|nr:hypothetical protein Pcinc_029509 [Petrolisthes cinctipes]
MGPETQPPKTRGKNNPGRKEEKTRETRELEPITELLTPCWLVGPACCYILEQDGRPTALQKRVNIEGSGSKPASTASGHRNASVVMNYFSSVEGKAGQAAASPLVAGRGTSEPTERERGGKIERKE